MRKLLLSTFLLLPALLFAECLSSDEAQSIAENFFSNAQSSTYKSASECPQVNLIWDGEEPVYRRAQALEEDSSTSENEGTGASTVNQDPAFYVFNQEGGKGFVIVSGETETAQPILGYSLDQSFEVDDMPDNIYQWMMGYRKEIQTARENLAEKQPSVIKPDTIHPMPPIKLLETALWDQSAPYNSLLPDDYVTGCPGTAACIIMRYHQWPNKGVGTIPSVNEKIGSLELGYSYNWKQMPLVYTDESTTEQNKQVATLMRDVGVMLRTNYSFAGSSAHPEETMPRFLPLFFRYNAKTIQSLLRINYDDAVWHTILQKEFNENRPILYCGFNLSSGHAFVLDGYAANDYYHVNWGWSGRSNGYYLLSTMNPQEQGAGGSGSKDGFTINQSAVIGIQPDSKNSGGGEYDLLEYVANKEFLFYGLLSNETDYQVNKEFKMQLTDVVNKGTRTFDGKLVIAHYNQNFLLKGFVSDVMDFSQKPLQVHDTIAINIMVKIKSEIEENDYIVALYQTPMDTIWKPLRNGDTLAKFCFETTILKYPPFPTLVEEVTPSTIRVYGARGAIMIDGLTELTSIAVYNVNGQLVASAASDDSARIDLPTGQVYIVRVGEKSVKVKL